MHFPFELSITNPEEDLLLVIILNTVTAYFQCLYFKKAWERFILATL